MQTRRAVLAAAGSLLATGCLESSDATAPGEGESPSPTDGPATEESPMDGTDTDTPLDDCTSGFSVSAESFAPAAALPASLEPAERSLLEPLFPEGSTEVTTYADEAPLRDRIYVERDGAYFQVRTTRLSQEEVPARLFDVHWEDGRTPPEGATVVDFENLPTADRRAVRLVVEGPKYSREKGGEEEGDGHPTQELSHTDYPAPYPNGTDDSRLVGAGTTWVRWNGRPYRVRVEGTGTNTRYTYGVTVSQVASDAAGFRRHVADEHLVDLSSLPSGASEIVETATGGTYEECSPASEALTTLQERLPASEQLPPPHGQSWYVAFGGSRHRLWVTNWVE